MKAKLKWSVLFPAVVILALGMAGCGNAAKSKVPIRLAYIFTGVHSEAPVYEPYLKDFAATNPDINLVAEPMPGGTPDIQAKLYTQAAAGSLPDVFISWPGPGMLKNFISANAVADLKDYIAKDPQFSSYFKNKGYLFENSVQFVKDGPIWGMPEEVYYMFLTVNKKLFDQAGVSVPTTYDDVKKIIPAFKAKGIIPMAMAGKDQDMNVCFWFGLLNRFGTNDEIIKGITQGGVTQYPAFLNSAKVIYEMAGWGAFPEACTAKDSGEAMSLFDSGKAAMYYGGTWYIGNVSAETAKDCAVVPLWTFAGARGDSKELLGGIAVEYLVSAKGWADKDHHRGIDKLLHALINPALSAKLTEVGVPPLLDVQYSEKASKLLIAADKLAKGASRFQMNYDAYGNQPGNDALNNLSQGLLNRSITPEQAVQELDKQIRSGISQ